jgi:hypothetical protein
VSPAAFHAISTALLLLWSLLGIGMMLSPPRLVRTLTRGRVVLPRSGVLFFRILGAINSIGALHVVWTGGL